MQMFNAEYLQEKWSPLLDYQGLDTIKDSHRRMVTAVSWKIKKKPSDKCLLPEKFNSNLKQAK
jgi:hypothetical protein